MTSLGKRIVEFGSRSSHSDNQAHKLIKDSDSD